MGHPTIVPIADDWLTNEEILAVRKHLNQDNVRLTKIGPCVLDLLQTIEDQKLAEQNLNELDQHTQAVLIQSHVKRL